MALNVRVTDHACDRFVDRVRPTMNRRQARIELERLIAFGSLEPDIEWAESAADAYLLLSDGIALALKSLGASWLAVSTIVRGGVTPRKAEERRRRRAKKRADRDARAARTASTSREARLQRRQRRDAA